MKLRIILLLTFILLSTSAYTQQKNVYNIDGYFEAFFPGKPLLFNKAEGGVYYVYSNTDNSIAYRGTYLTLQNKKSRDDKLFLHSMLIGYCKDDGTLEKEEYFNKDGNEGVVFIIRFKALDYYIINYGVGVVKNNVLIMWEIREAIDEYCTVDEESFYKKLQYFKVF